MSLLKLFRRPSYKDQAHDLYAAVITQSRLPVFYERLGVADTLDGRFDMITLHAFLVLQRLRAVSLDEKQAAELGQTFSNLIFSDFDSNLREMGVGDLSVGPKIKRMAAAFMGRVKAYQAAFAANEDALTDALRRNLYRGEAIGGDNLSEMVAYVQQQRQHLADQADDSLMRGAVLFYPPALEAV